jgi:hypothetical protein
MSRKSLACVLSGALAVGAFAVSGPASAAIIGPSPNLFATVDQSGNLITGNGVSSVTHLSTGRYEVTFMVDVSQCAYVATTDNAFSQALTVFTAGGHLNADGVYVETKNQGGGLTDGPFNLVVDCGKAGMKYAVVGRQANLVRSTAGTTLTSLGSGRYDVTFADDVARCAYLATVGDPHNGLVFNPSGVYTGSGPDSHTVYIETKNPGGGLQSGIPFQLAVICPRPNVRVAVVNAGGLIDRGSPLTSSFEAATGNYTIVTDRSVASCATVGTRGSVDTAVPFNPATVEVAPGPANNTVGIQVRALLFFGGDFTDEAFHAAIVC